MKRESFYYETVRFDADVLDAVPVVGTEYPGTCDMITAVEELSPVRIDDRGLNASAYRVTTRFENGDLYEYYCLVPRESTMNMDS